MRYVVDCVIMHPRKQALGLRRSGGEGTPRVGDVLDVRIAGHPLPIQIDS